MLSKQRIKEAELNFKQYLNEGLLKKELYRKEIYNTFIDNFNQSIKLLNIINKENISNLWQIVVSYYTMFYIANAFLYKLGFKTGNKIVHKVVSDSLIVLAREKLKETYLEDYETIKNEALELAYNKADEILDYYDKERIKRNIFQYETHEEIKKSKAKTSFERAILFSNEILKLLNKDKI
ncbi:MAG: hypothetical protein QXE31_02405 [Candidatus Woesearchaeota archaeon]